MFVAVTICAGLVVPMTTGPKLRLSGFSSRFGSPPATASAGAAKPIATSRAKLRTENAKMNDFGRDMVNPPMNSAVTSAFRRAHHFPTPDKFAYWCQTGNPARLSPNSRFKSASELSLRQVICNRKNSSPRLFGGVRISNLTFFESVFHFGEPSISSSTDRCLSITAAVIWQSRASKHITIVDRLLVCSWSGGLRNLCPGCGSRLLKSTTHRHWLELIFRGRVL
jgi:hypothetical protein